MSIKHIIIVIICSGTISCAETGSKKTELNLATIVKTLPSKNCTPIGVMYGRSGSKEKALLDLRSNTTISGGSHVIITETNTNNKDEFTIFTNVTSVYYLGDGYSCH